eukprot:6566889-Karenia_brevis.AAC.1
MSLEDFNSQAHGGHTHTLTTADHALPVLFTRSQLWQSLLERSKLQPGGSCSGPPQPAIHHQYSFEALAAAANVCLRCSVLKRW